jgi:aryl-alcohol dehydrogenase-like predicted oxidoreductase
MLAKRPLGKTGLQVTPVGFGSQTIGGLGYGDQDFGLSEATVTAYLEAGGRFIDSARGYGMSEVYVGKALAKFARADEVLVTSKSGSLHPPVIRSDLDVSRHCLGRDRIDIYFVHVPPPDFDQLRRVLDAYQQYKDQGKIRLIGVSCRGLANQEERDEVLRYFEDGRIDVLQFPYGLAHVDVAPLIAAARQRGIGTVARRTLEGGLFIDALAPGSRFADRANDWRASLRQDVLDQILALVQEIRRRFAVGPYTSVAQVALLYALAHPDVSAIIPGAGTPAEMRQNMTLNDLPPLPAATVDELTKIGRKVGELLRTAR